MCNRASDRLFCAAKEIARPASECRLFALPGPPRVCLLAAVSHWDALALGRSCSQGRALVAKAGPAQHGIWRQQATRPRCLWPDYLVVFERAAEAQARVVAASQAHPRPRGRFGYESLLRTADLVDAQYLIALAEAGGTTGRPI